MVKSSYLPMRLGLAASLTWLVAASLAANLSATAFAQTPGGVIGGDRVDIEAEDAAPESLSEPKIKVAPVAPVPFGSNLFRGGFRAEREDGLNPDYVIRPGDRITLRIWGAMTFEDTVVADARGNIFVPEIGPIQIENVRIEDLTNHVRRSLQRTFTDNINVYTNVESTTPVIVYVTGAVVSPGSFAGVASDSLLYFLDRAGGIDPERGSYRDIRVLRDNVLLARSDLYEFLMDGLIPRIQFQDNDTILVGPRGGTVTARGAVRNNSIFEFLPEGLSGGSLMRLARIDADASHAVITGTRRRGPALGYLPLSAFELLQLQDGDEIIFEADESKGSIMIRVEGSHLGSSRFAVPRETTLSQILDYIEIDPKSADIRSISLKRQSIAERQKQALEDTLRRLEAAMLSATSATDEEAIIRAEESKLIAKFVERARKIEPGGVLVVAEQDEIRDIQLQNDDIITIPELSDIVLVTGEVVVPQALVYRPGNTTEAYIARVGGYTNRADEDQILLVRRSGEVIRNIRDEVRPGDEIIVLPEIPVKNLQFAKTIFEILFQTALIAGVVLGI